MVRHIVLLKPRAEHAVRLTELGETIGRMLADHFPRVRAYSHGKNQAPVERQHGFSHGFSMDFDDMTALATYGDAPAHQPVKALVRELCESTLAFDYSL